jgi:carboxyl-terminal processing protease
MNKFIATMTNKKMLPIWAVVLLGGAVFGVVGFTKRLNNIEEGKYEKILHRVGQFLQYGHFSPQKIDDKFSQKVFDKYLDVLDGQKLYFTQEDISSIAAFKNKIDNEIQGEKVVFFTEAGKIYSKRLLESQAIYTDLLSKPFNFNVKEQIELDADKRPYAKNDQELKEEWRKRMKYLVLREYVSLQEQREKTNGSIKKTDIELEKEARDKVLKQLNIQFEKQKTKNNDDDRFNYFVNTVVGQMDPHTDYFAAQDKRNFEEGLSGTFYGIGASLTEDENGNIKIATLVTGSPAWKSGQLVVGDVILKVGQGKDEPTDVVGFAVNDAVKLIRGKEKNSEVRLTIRKQDGTTKIVSLMRDVIKLEETFARSSIVTMDGKKLGIIHLPDFYANFNGMGRSCSADVAAEIKKLKADGIEGLIIDLRFNGGGSLEEVIKMMGLFIEEGPVVQVKELQSEPRTGKDYDNSVLYDGPLTVMVNEFSASASEIFAAAVQDYKRGLVIGSTSTYGKGTVQRNINLDNTDESMGAIKLTIQKFYRVNGGSTQRKGVESDIVVPDSYEYFEMREKNEPAALPYDEINSSKIKLWNPGYDANTIKQLGANRISNNTKFNQFNANLKQIQTLNKKPESLQIAEYKKELKELQSLVKQNDSLLKVDAPLNIELNSRDKADAANDKEKENRLGNFTKALKNDVYVNEAAKVVVDMINQKAVAQKN